MSESVQIANKLKIYEKGIFDLNELYKLIKSWLAIEGYGDEEKTFREVSYVERFKAIGKQIEAKWKAEKLVNDYISYAMTITFNIIGLNEIEIEQQGRKVKMHKGTITIRISSELILDRQNKWKSDFFRKLYENFIIKDRIEAHKINLYNKTYSLHDEIKAYFQMLG
jgi:hypothetical protein